MQREKQTKNKALRPIGLGGEQVKKKKECCTQEINIIEVLPKERKQV